MRCFPGVERVLEDSTHVLRRIYKSLPRGHPLAGDYRLPLPATCVLEACASELQGSFQTAIVTEESRLVFQT